MGTTAKKRRLWVVLAAVAVVTGLVAPATTAPAEPAAPAGPVETGGRGGGRSLPIVFVHGGSGSAAQYQTQALRFASNGYPYQVRAIDRPAGQDVNPLLDDFLDQVMAETGAPRVYVVAHSIGVSIVTSYLNSAPERAARVARYLAIDGGGASPDACPGGVDDDGEWVVPCKGIFGRGDPDRRFGPDDNVQFADQGHTEVVGSPESFVEQYRFFTGRDPRTTLVLPEPPDRVEIAGRALAFPANTPLVGSTVEVWEVDGDTGARTRRRPRAVFEIGEDGDWGPIRVDGRRHHELAVVRGDVVQHFYFEPFLRSDHLIRLLLSPPDSPISQGIERSDHHSVAVVQRQKEFWGDNPLGPVDELRVSTDTAGGPHQPPADLINPVTAPYTENFVLGIITFDAGTDGVTDTSQQVPLETFLSVVDVFYPAAEPPDGTVTFDLHTRGEPRRQVLRTPNWASTGHGISVNFRNWTQDVDTWDECRRARPRLCR
jgi:pimeloyl-ACP methyl ester carboxylesterase